MRRKRIAFLHALTFLLAWAWLGSARGAAQSPTLPEFGRATFGSPQTLEPVQPAPRPVDEPGTTPNPIAVEAQKEVAPALSAARRFGLGAYWDNGLYFDSDDKQFRLHVGGNAQIDSVWFMPPSSAYALPGGAANGVSNANATIIRRARLRLDGTIFGQFDYMAELDFANAANDNTGTNEPLSFSSLIGTPTPCNVWVQVRDVPLLGNVRAGYQVKPIGMTNNTNQALLPFMERADNMDAFYGPFDNGFTLGVSARNALESERATWQFGAYRPMTNAFGVALNKYEFGGRATALPWYADDGRQLVHVGFGTLDGDVVEDVLRLRARPLLRNGPGFAVPVLVDTGDIPGNKQFTLAPEFALVWNSLTVQAEWCGQYLTDAIVNSANVGTVFYHGGYVEVLYFLTGEYQPYAKGEGVFGRVIPREDYHWRKGEGFQGLGAWQVGARFSYLDLNDRGVQGGTIYDWTFGLNWYLNPNMKFQVNYVLEHRNQPGVPPGWINGIGARAAYDF
jgi:phosphate-selective porin OprO/OprP